MIYLDADIKRVLSKEMTTEEFHQRNAARAAGAAIGVGLVLGGHAVLAAGAGAAEAGALSQAFRLTPVARGFAVESILAEGAAGGALARNFRPSTGFFEGLPQA